MVTLHLQEADNTCSATPAVDPLLVAQKYPTKTLNSDERKGTPTSIVGKQMAQHIDAATAEKLFNHYVQDMAEHLPAVVFLPGTTAAEVQKDTPVLFLAIMVAASVGLTSLEIQHNLSQMVLDIYADAIIRNGMKSLELVQALMVSAIWYRPPQNYEAMNFYMLTHMAVVMAMDLGMGKKVNRSKTDRMQASHEKDDQARADRHIYATDSPEARRTWVGCYFIATK